MKTTYKFFTLLLLLGIISGACKKQEYSMGDMTAPSNILITTEIVGQDENHPNGDGSGNIKVTVTADNAIGVLLDYDASDRLDLKPMTASPTIIRYLKTGLNTYTITAVVTGKGGAKSTATKDVTVRSDFNADPVIITNLTSDASKTWVVDKSVAGHLGVGPWANSSVTPEWWSAAVNEKVNCCNCFYTSTFTFTKDAASGTYSLTVATPDGAFTKTGDLAGGLPGIPASGDEGCYTYAGGTSAFSFVPASTGIDAETSTQTSIKLVGNTTFIGYGATLKEYEILEITADYLYLRVQGTETGNAWYLKLKPAGK